jgi:pimeloyl-ACP methyl ester carboxylesterase
VRLSSHHGEQEVIYNNLRSAIRSVRELIPGAEVELIPGVHHIIAVANPDKVNQKLMQFFAE